MMKKQLLPLSSMCFALIISTGLLLGFCGCKNDNKKPVQIQQYEDMPSYEERVSNIIPYLNKHQLLPAKPTDIYLLQVDKCNICNKSNLEEIYQQQKKAGSHVLFVFTSADADLLNESLTAQFKDVPFSIYYDSTRELGKMGLSFMKNLYVRMDSGKIKNWKFL